MEGGLAGQSPEEGKAPDVERTVRQELLRIAPLVGEDASNTQWSVEAIATHRESGSLTEPSDRIQVAYKDRLELVFARDPLRLFSIRRPALWSDVEKREPTSRNSAWGADVAHAQAKKLVSRTLGAFPEDLALFQCTFNLRPPQLQGVWDVTWVRTCGGFRTEEQVRVLLDEKEGLVYLMRNSPMPIETTQCELTKEQAQACAVREGIRVLQKFSSASFQDWLRGFALAQPLTADEAGDLGPLLGLWVIRPQYPLRQTFHSLEDFSKPSVNPGRLSYCFAYRMHGPALGEGMKIEDRELLIWIDAFNGEVLRVSF